MENPNKKNVFFSIEISDIIFWLMKWKWVVIACTILFSILGYLFSNLTYNPIYTAKASMVVNSKQTKIVDGQIVMPNDVYLAQQLMATYTSVLTSDKIISYVIDTLDLNKSVDSIRGSIKITAAEDTQVVYIEVSQNDPYLSKNIANAIMEEAPKLMRETVEVGSVNILDFAKLPKTPKAPSTVQYILVFMLMGLLLSAAAVIFANFVTMKVKNSDDIEDKTSIPVFGEVPHASIKADRKKTFLFTGEANSGFTESYFMTGAVLKNAVTEKRPYKFIVTSSIAGEGKTTTSINLTTVLADMGHKVLLIDLDMKKPNVSRQLELDVKERGGIEAVIKGAEMENEILTTDFGFDLIPCAKPVRSTSKLLSSLRLERFFTELNRTDYDFIVIDTAPAHIIADTSVIVKYADGLVMVIKQQFARLKVIMDTVNNLRKSGANIIGSVLNDVRVYNIGTGYTYKYKYGYYYYYKDPEKAKKRAGKYGYGNYYSYVYDSMIEDSDDAAPKELAEEPVPEKRGRRKHTKKQESQDSENH